MTQYLIQKYIEYGLLKKDGTHVLNEDEDFDPYIYPAETKISYCSVCQGCYEFFKTSVKQEGMKVEMEHPKACIWFDYFVDKIKNTVPSANIIRKKK